MAAREVAVIALARAKHDITTVAIKLMNCIKLKYHWSVKVIAKRLNGRVNLTAAWCV